MNKYYIQQWKQCLIKNKYSKLRYFLKCVQIEVFNLFFKIFQGIIISMQLSKYNENYT